MPVLQIVIASTRPGRVGEPVGRWFERHAQGHAGFEVEVTDLKQLALPMMDEPAHPRLGDYQHEHTRAWSAIVDRSDAFVFVMPEYNYGYTAPLKNAIDYLHREWQHKPLGFVSYGGVAGGTRAVQLLKPVVSALKLTPVSGSVILPFVFSQVADGVFTPADAQLEGATAMLDELLTLAEALKPLRAG